MVHFDMPGVVFLDKCQKVKISELVENGVFDGERAKGAIIGGHRSIAFQYSRDVISFEYETNKGIETVNYDIVKRPTNLGIGSRYYFKCPVTERLCTKLYIIPGGSIVTRSMIDNAVYSYQRKSTYDRLLYRINCYDTDITRPYGKQYYRGKITPYGKKLDMREYWSTMAMLQMAVLLNSGNDSDMSTFLNSIAE